MHQRTTREAVTPWFAPIDKAIRRVLGRHPEHEDLAQTTWVRLLERLATGEPIESLLGFAIGIAQNVVREHARRGARRRTLRLAFRLDLAALCGHAPPSPETQCELGEMVIRLERAMLRLSSQERWLIDARFTEERDYQEMLARFQRLHHPRIRSPEGLRTAVFQAKLRLARAVVGACELR